MRSRIGSRSHVTLLFAALLSLAAFACTEPAPRRGHDGQGAKLQLTASVAGTPVSTLVVAVSAADIQPALVFNLETVNGVASGTLTIPPGPARTIVVRAFDASGVETHEGQKTVDVRDGANPVVDITLLPLAGSQPIDVHLGNILVSVTPGDTTVRTGQTLRFTAVVTDLDGNAVSVDPRAIRWATFDPRVATVDTAGAVTGGLLGSVQIVASYAGSAGAAHVSVIASPVILAAGDIAECNASPPYDVVDGDEATTAIIDTLPGTLLALGDIAYPDGNTFQLTNCYDPSWGKFKSRTRPAPGNHDYHVTDAADYFAYFGDAAGPAGRGYYSFDVGAWHIISLNTNISVADTSTQAAWLRADLAATKAKCVLAYWHRPRFSSGNHGDATAMKPLWNQLYAAGAELVLNGHDHDYERFAPQDPSGVADPAKGIREFVVGTGGGDLVPFSTVDVNSELRIASTWGVLRLVLRETSYEWQFVTAPNGVVQDSGSGSCH